MPGIATPSVLRSFSKVLPAGFSEDLVQPVQHVRKNQKTLRAIFLSAEWGIDLSWRNFINTYKLLAILFYRNTATDSYAQNHGADLHYFVHSAHLSPLQRFSSH